MKTVYFFEWHGRKNKIKNLLTYPLLFWLFILLAGMMADGFFPGFNAQYMKWPDYIKQLLGIGGWSGRLWYNMWQFFAVFYPFFHIYVLMNCLLDSLQDEIQLETIVFLRNTGVGNVTVMGTKFVCWAGVALLGCLSQFLLLALFGKLSGIGVVTSILWRYYGVLFAVSVFYMAVALYVSVGRQKRQECKDTHLTLLVLPWLLAKVPGVIFLFAELLKLTGRSEVLVTNVAIWEEKTAFLRFVSPVAWCSPQGTEISFGIAAAYVLIAGILGFFALKKYREL